MKPSPFIGLLILLFFSNFAHSQCAPEIPNYINIGQLNGHNYYLSTVNARPTDAQAAAEALGGYLAVIDDVEEDEFIQNYISELVYIGLNDAENEGTFEWFNGAPVTYTNIAPCGFCNSNADDQDYLVKQPWNNGGWSFSNFWNQRKYIVEIPCGSANTDCSFFNLWENENSFYPGVASSIVESADGYEMRFEGFGIGTRRMTKWFLDQQGQTISTSDIEIPFFTSGYDLGRYSTLGDYFFMHTNDGLNPQLLKVDFSGNIVFEKTYNVNTTIPNVNYTISRNAWEDSDGILITGHSGNGPGGDRQPYLIKTDLDGNEMWQKILPNENNFLSFSILDRASDGGYYLSLWSGATSPAKVIKIDANGNTIWTHSTSNNVSNVERNFVGESSDGSGFYYTQYIGFVSPEVIGVRLSTSNGSVDWERNIGNSFGQPSPTYDYIYRGALATNDGALMVQYTWSLTATNGTTFADFGNHYGKIDANGNVVWDYEMPRNQSNFHIPIYTTSDGGFLFTGSSGNDKKFVWKYTSEGWNAPICEAGMTGEVLQVDCELDFMPSGLQVDPSDPSGMVVTWNPPTASTDCPGGVTIEQISGSPSGSFFQAWTTTDHIIVYRVTDACGNEEICTNEFGVNGIYGGVNCPADMIVDASSSQGAIVNYDLPIITPSTCVPGDLQLVGGLPSGSTFPVGTTEVQYLSFFGGSNTYCQNGVVCSFNVTVNPYDPVGGECPNDISGFTSLGEFGSSKYYISNGISRPTDAQAIAESNGGYLVAISSQEENDFIQQNISEMVYIGLNDQDVENQFEWFNGEPFTFDNINPCGFCNGNAADQDFLIMAPWNGDWSFSNFWNQRKYVMEIPCGGSTGGGDCAFITQIATQSSPLDLDIITTNDGYQAQLLYSSFSIDYQEVDLNGNGVITSINDIAPNIPNSSTYLKDQNFYVTFPMIDGTSFDLSAFEVSGSPKWSSTFAINTIDPDADVISSLRLVDVGDGIMGFGIYHFGNAATWRQFVIKIDYQGNEVFQKNHEVTNDFLVPISLDAAKDGGLYYLRRSDAASGFFGRVASNGDLVWENSVIGDLVTNKIYFVGETPDDQSVYLSVADNNSYRAYIRKYNVMSGSEEWEVDLNALFSPDRFGTTFGYRGAAVTPDGGVFAAISYSEPGGSRSGVEYGRIDANGNLQWWYDAPIGLSGMLATKALEDGSLFFTKSIGGQSLTLIRMNEDGTIDPTCTSDDLPDLELANSKFFGSPFQVGQTYPAYFEINNNSLTSVSQYEIGVYLQEFSGQNPTEYFVESIPYSNATFGYSPIDLEVTIPNVPEGQYRLVLVIDDMEVINESDEQNNREISNIFSVVAPVGNLPDLTVSNLTNLPSAGESGEVVFFNFDLNNIGNITASGSYNINSYISTDATFSGDDILAGEVPTGDTPVGTIPNVPAAITVPNLPDGNYFLILVTDAFNDIIESNENNNTLTVSFEITSGGGGDCPTTLSGYTSLGEFNGSAYFLSTNIARPVDAQSAAEAVGGNLVTIASQAENDFLFPQISEVVYIGLNDFGTENTLEWSSGDAVNYTNFDICNFCSANSDEMDFAIMHSWNGGWSWSNFFNNRKYIVEIPCASSATNSTISNPLIAQITPPSENVNLMLEKVYPNPAEQSIFTKISSPKEQVIDIQIFDARGSIKFVQSVNLLEGENVIEIPIGELPAGFYSIFVPKAQGKNSAQRFMKIRD